MCSLMNLEAHFAYDVSQIWKIELQKYSCMSGEMSELIHHWQTLILDPGFCDSVKRALIPHETTPLERAVEAAMK